jgi:ssDNA thymidine ADP-ribosyltransferase DarT-like protein
MKREELEELHYITPIANVPSILSGGILSHRGVEKIAHQSVAMEEVQDRRAKVVVPGGRRLHDYVNLYVCARNPMMFKRKDAPKRICVLRVGTAVLDLPGAIVTDMNAAKDIVRFRPAAHGLQYLDRDLVFADDWRHPNDYWAYERHRAIKCAEVLIPDGVDPSYLIGAYTSCAESEAELLEVTNGGLAVSLNSQLFFQ